jgi:hypothetical protein
VAEPVWDFVLRALAALGGSERGVFYDVPRGDAPRSLTSTRVFVQGSPAWRRFLATRVRFDDGALTLLLSLRPLADDERYLAVGWGCRFANTFLLVEPIDPACDLTDPANAVRRTLEATAREFVREHRPDNEAGLAGTQHAPLDAALRGLFGHWITWPESIGDANADVVPLRPDGPKDTLRRRLMVALEERYPQDRFDAALARLYERERELFGGTVADARLPFLTRLGLPVVYDPRRVDHAVRRMVNAGQASLVEVGADPAFYRGPRRPLPDHMTDAEIGQLVLR